MAKRITACCACTLAAGLAVSLGLFFGARAALLAPFREKLRADVIVRTRLIEAHLDRALLVARAAQAHLQDGGAAGVQRLRSFALPVLAAEKGLESFAWIPRDPIAGPPAFEVTPASDEAIGSEWLDALRRAGGGTTPGLLDLGRSSARQREGFAACLPVGTQAQPPAGAAVPRKGAEGNVCVLFSADRIIGAALRSTPAIGLPFELWDVSSGEDQRLVYRWSARLAEPRSWKRVLYAPLRTEVARFEIADHTWEVRAAPNLGYLERDHPLAHWMLLLFGAALSLLAAGFVCRSMSQRERLQALNRALGAEIQERQSAQAAQGRLVEELQAALADVKRLEGILPICASCKKIRDGSGSWTQLEYYITQRSEASFTHSLCPDCQRRLYPDLWSAIDDEGAGPR